MWRMATIARFYAHEIEWPKDLTDYQSEEICRLFLLARIMHGRLANVA